MSRSAFEALGISYEKAEKMVAAYNEHDTAAMLALSDAHQLGVPSHENKTFINRVRKFIEEQDPQMRVEMKKIKEED